MAGPESAPDVAKPNTPYRGEVASTRTDEDGNLVQQTEYYRYGKHTGTGTLITPHESSNGTVATLERPSTDVEFAHANGSGGEIVRPEGVIPTPEAQNDDPLRIVLASLDQNVDAFAREAAHEKISKEHEGGWWKRKVKSAWHTMTREYQVVKATKEAREKIIENENLLHHQGKNDQKWREATIDRYGSEYGEHLIHEGETFHKLSSPEAAHDPKAERIRGDIQDVMRQVARGEVVDDESLRMIVDRMTETWRQEKISQDYIGEGQFLANNIGRKARELEGMMNSAEGLSAVEQEALLEQHLGRMQIVAGEARVGSRTEIDSTLSERVAEKLRGVPFVSEKRIAAVTSALGNETTVAAMMSGAIYGAKRGASLAGKIIAPGIGAGVVAAIRERNALIDERSLEERRSDAGKAAAEVPDDSELSGWRKAFKKVGIGKSAEEYRAELNATQYEARPVGELLDDLSGLYNESGELNIRDRQSFDEAMKLMGQVRSRIRLGDRTGARLISFADASPEEMESRRFDLDLAMAKFETDMKKTTENPVAQAMLDITDEEKFDELFAQQQNIAEGMIMGEMKAKDRLFRKLVVRRALKRAIATTFMGAAVGGAVKYGTEAVREVAHTVRQSFAGLFNQQGPEGINLASYNTELGSPLDNAGNPAPTEIGGNPAPTEIGGNPAPTSLGENPAPTTLGGNNPAPEVVGGNPAPTVLGGNPAPTVLGGEHAPGAVGGNHAPGTLGGEAAPADTSETIPITDTSKINVPEGYKAEVNSGTGAVTLTGPDGKEYPNLGLKPDGSFSEPALEELRAGGLNITDNQEIVAGKPEITHSTVRPSEFAKHHSREMKRIHHTRWFDNNTSKFDLNELGLDNHMDGSGNVVVDIRGMTAGGSFHGASGVNWQEAAKEGHLKVYLSASEGTQAHAFEIPVRSDGTVVIDKGSPAASLFDSRGTFIGGYQEVALSGGQAADGGENIATLATVEGKQQETLRDTVQKPTFQTTHTYTIRPNPVTQPTAFTQPAPTGPYPFIPVVTRRRVGGTTEAAAERATAPAAATSGAESAPGRAATSPISGEAAPDSRTASGGAGEAGPSGRAASGPEATPGSSRTTTSGPETAPSGTTTGAPRGPEAAARTATAGSASAESAGRAAYATTTAAGELNGPAEPTRELGSAEAPVSSGGDAVDNSGAASAGPEAAPEAASPGPILTEEDRKYMTGLDEEKLSTPSGYDFADYTKYGARERKQAVRFLNEAMNEVGGSDKAAVVARAQELAQQAARGANGEMANFYAESLNILQKSAERVERDTGKGPDGERYLTDLDSETASFPFERTVNASAYAPNVQKLVARIYRGARATVEAERGPAPDSRADPEAYNAWTKALFRRAQRVTHPDQYSNLSDEQRELFAEAQKVFGEASEKYAA